MSARHGITEQAVALAVADLLIESNGLRIALLGDRELPAGMSPEAAERRIDTLQAAITLGRAIIDRRIDTLQAAITLGRAIIDAADRLSTR